ncbi:ATP-dependent DNA ligase [Candidatus Aenigmatarchaeota archaeon]
MRYSKLAEIYEKLENTPKKLKKRDILADLYKKTKSNELRITVLLSMGAIFPRGEYDLGIAREMVKKTISKTYGINEKDITKKFKETGDLGLVAEFFASHKKQKTLGSKELHVEKVFDNLEKLPTVSGGGSQDRKMALVSELLSFASGKEARYVVRTTLGDMRIGVAEGIVRDAIALAFDKDKKDVEKLYDIIGDYGKVAVNVKKGIMKAEMKVGKAIRVMLAERSGGLEDAWKKAYSEPTVTEIKYDGFRVQIHKDGDKIKIFSRRMEDVSRQFPDLVSLAKKNITAEKCIIEGEVVAIDKNGKSKPFQVLSRRIQRKHNIEKMVKEIPVRSNFFDLIYIDGENYMQKPLRKRWDKLKKIIKQTKDFKLAEHIESKDKDEVEKFYEKSLAMGEEGIIIKYLDAQYQPGKRVGYWLKVKPTMEPLDLVIVGAEWGEGKRAKWFGSLLLACRQDDKYIETGRMASGLTEEQMADITKRLRPLITEEHGKRIKVQAKFVVEIGYEEIQVSSKYPSGYALRFPKLLCFRPDRSADDCTTLKEIIKLYGLQRAGLRKSS